MQGQCPKCNGKFEIQPEWVGQQSQCPYCHAQITIQEAVSMPSVNPAPAYYPPQASMNQMPQNNNATPILPLILGICSIVLCFPIITLPCGIAGLILSIKTKYNVGIILSSIGMGLSLINAIVGIIMMIVNC